MREHSGYFSELSNEHFLHLWVQVYFRFFYKDQVDTGSALLGLEGFEELVELEQNKHEIPHAQAVVGFGQVYPVHTCVMHPRMILEQAFNVERGFRKQAGITEAWIAEQGERWQQ